MAKESKALIEANLLNEHNRGEIPIAGATDPGSAMHDQATPLPHQVGVGVRSRDDEMVRQSRGRIVFVLGYHGYPKDRLMVDETVVHLSPVHANDPKRRSLDLLNPASAAPPW